MLLKMLTNNQKNLATFIHLSTFSRFFIPFGNFIGPIVLWSINKNKSSFIDQHGKQIINFQFSILLYVIILGTMMVPFFVFHIFEGLNYLDIAFHNNIHIDFDKASPLLYFTGFLGGFAILAFIIELVLIIKASLKARDGEMYKYPFTINFLK